MNGKFKRILREVSEPIERREAEKRGLDSVQMTTLADELRGYQRISDRKAQS